MSWPAAEGRHYSGPLSRCWYGSTGLNGHTRPDQTGDTMSHSGTDYRPAETSGSVASSVRHAAAGRTPVVSFVNVSKHYGNLKAVEGLNLDLRAGETVALLGPNGAGKSTSLDMLLALRKP